MGTRPSREVAGGIHHVFSKGNRGQPIFLERADQRSLLRQVRHWAAEMEWTCLAYCLMGNHFHLLLETPRPNLGAGMQQVLWRHARAYNDERGEAGRLFQGRFGSKVVLSDEYFATVLRYIALNPVNHGFVSDPAGWPWSSHAAMLKRAAGPLVAVDRVLDLLETWGGERHERYAALFEAGSRFGPWSAARDPRPPIDTLVEPGCSDADLRRARHNFGYSARQVAAAAGLSHATVLKRTA